MNAEDFLESVAAGWIPVAWHPVSVALWAAFKWVTLHVLGFAAVRLRK